MLFPSADTMLRTPLWPFAEPPNFGDIDIGLWERESCITIVSDGDTERKRIASATGFPEIFIRALGLYSVNVTI